MKRFYTEVTVTAATGGHAIMLDGRPLRTPARAPFVVPTLALATAVADEWMAQGDAIAPSAMPLTGIANAAIDLAAPDREAFAAPLAAYAGSDLLCYRAPEADLAAEEAAAWNPWLAWAEQRFGVEFALATGIVHTPQPPPTLAALGGALAALDAWTLAALAPVITMGGSLVIGLALAHGAFAADAGWAAVTLDDHWQESRWGVDADAAAARARRADEWRAATRFLTLIDG